MVKDSLMRLLEKYPYFFNKQETSNFFKSQRVSNEQFQQIYQSLAEVSESFNLRKNCLIWRVQEEEYAYTLNFVANYPHLKSVKLYKNDSLLYSEDYTYEDDEDTFFYSYSGCCLNDPDEEIIDDNEEVSYNIIPISKFRIIVETYDEIILEKGYPENDILVGDVFDHDTSLDRFGKLHNIPRKEYRLIDNSEDYPLTEPPYNDKLSEDDYHYMNRILNYLLMYHILPLPVLEIWKLYGITPTMENRSKYLLKVFDEKAHTIDGVFDPDWIPKPWEHKDTFEDYGTEYGRYFFASVNTTVPAKGTSVTLKFLFLNNLAEPLIGDYNVDIELNETSIETDYTGASKVIHASSLDTEEPNYFTITGKDPNGDIIGVINIIVTVKGCDTANYYVKYSTGSDSNDGKSRDYPFKTIEKAVSMVHGDKNSITIISDNYTINSPITVAEDCTIMGCDDGITLSNTDNKFFKVNKNVSLTLVNLTLGEGYVESMEFVNHNQTNPLYVISLDEPRTSTVLTLSSSSASATVGQTITLSGVLKDVEDNKLSGKTITIGSTELTTDSNGAFSTTVTLDSAGSKTFTARFSGDEDYSSSSASVNVTVSKKLPTLAVSGGGTITVGATSYVTGTLKYNNSGISGVAIGLYDGATLVDEDSTGNDGSFSLLIPSDTVGSFTYKVKSDETSIYQGVTSSDISVTVNKLTSAVTLATSSASVQIGTAFTLSGNLTAGGSGISGVNLKLYDGATLIDSAVATGSGGAFSKTITPSASHVGSHSYTVVYDGDSTHTNVTSTAVSVTVTKKSTALTLATDKASVDIGEQFTLSGTLTSGATGLHNVYVKIYDGNNLMWVVATDDGDFEKSYIFDNQGLGTHTFHVEFEGDSTYASATSSNVSVVCGVTPVPTSVTLTSDKSTITSGETVTFTATVLDQNDDPLSGETVTFKRGPTVLGNDTTDASGEATYQETISLSPGSYSFSAYASNGVYGMIMITVVAPTPVPASVSLTGDKSILSYADSESCTLTATVYDDSSSALPMEGVTVTFKKGTVTLGTDTTDSNGEATYTYSSAGVGDISFTAEVGSLVSETYSITDIKYYDPLTSDKGHWTIPSGAPVTFSSTGMALGSSGWNDFYLEIPITKPCEIEYDIVSWTGSTSYQLYLWDSTKTNRLFHLYRGTDGGGRTVFDTYPNYGNYWSSQLPSSCTVKIKVLSDKLELYIDGDYKVSKTYTMASPLIIGFVTASSRTTTYKNLKIKEL